MATKFGGVANMEDNCENSKLKAGALSGHKERQEVTGRLAIGLDIWWICL